MSDVLFYVYEVEATNVIGMNDSDTVWFYDLSEAFERVKDAIDDLPEHEKGRWEWSGSIKRVSVTWEEIEEAWEGSPPDKSCFMRAALAGEEGAK